MDALETIAALNHRFGIPGLAQVVAGNGGLAKVRVTAPACAGEIYLHGAHVTSWQPAGADEALFLSSQTRWEAGRAIRGGVPICFPWFRAKSDDPKAPAHGFARTKSWQLESVGREGDSVTVSMSTASDEGTQKWWPGDFRLLHRATFGSALSQELVVTNTGAKPLRFEEALHTYLKIADIAQSHVVGLNAVHYLDNTDANREKTQQGDIVIDSETDRAYLNTQGAVELLDPVLRRRFRVAKENSLTTVLWNPWIEKTRAFPDMADDEWKQMTCIEASNILGFAVHLPPGEQHRMKAVLTVAAL
ncbi:MAG: D-hexose-6-phosphate mutarotase [Candidatus Acidiferrales bacterium]